MKILDAWINDPTLMGTIKPPVLHVAVDSMPDETIPQETFFGGEWSAGKYGPFVKYANMHESVDAGDFNIKFRGRFPPVVDIVLTLVRVLEDDTETEEDIEGFSLPLNRARQLVRRHDSSWRLLLNDRAASDEGKLLWLPVQTHPVCRRMLRNEVCGRVPTRTIRVMGTDLPMCEDHIREHNENQAARRTAKAS